MTSLIEEGLTYILDGPAQSTPRRQIVIPTSRATGGIAAGINPDRIMQSADEADDVAAVEHMRIGFK
ncbi:MAG: hypothetical protein NW205_00895 [Hyphomicrobiaceae bacterium]|nr:hypothetical protein [Hyphomicrobiaceae bacterium]